MNLILIIPPQPATKNCERQAILLSCFRDGSLLLQGADLLLPGRFYLSPNDTFPWGQFIPKMLAAWQLGNYECLPAAFRPKKRIPQFVIDGLPGETLPNQLKILATLRKQGYFPALTKRKEK